MLFARHRIVRIARTTTKPQTTAVGLFKPPSHLYHFPRNMATESPAKKLKMDGPLIGTHR